MRAERADVWRGVTDVDWRSARWQMANALRTPASLAEIISLTDDEAAACTRSRFPVAITPYYASLIEPSDPACPIRRQCVPRLAELAIGADELRDPLAEDTHMPVAGLTHRYPDRTMLYASHVCPVYCRHCNRRRKVGDNASAPTRAQLAAAIDHIRDTVEIRDVLVSGGDPLSLSDERIDDLLGRLRSIGHVEIIRVATRCPATLPQRVTCDLASILARHQPLYVVTHFNHPRECTGEAAQALGVLADAGCVLANQMVLLRGVNDELETVRQLNHWLLAHRCRPYYIFHCDAAEGIGHFRTSVRSGIDIIDGLRGHTSGLAVPHYAVDLPGGGGKVSLQPEYLVERDGSRLLFRNYRGERFEIDDRC